MHETPHQGSVTPGSAGTDGFEINRLVRAVGDGGAIQCRLEVAVEPFSQGRRVCVIGELDVSTAESLKDQLLAEIDRSDVLLLDLSEVAFIDSTGLTALVVAAKHAQRRGTSLTLVEPVPSQPRRLFEVTGVLALLGLQPPAPGQEQ